MADNPGFQRGKRSGRKPMTLGPSRKAEENAHDAREARPSASQEPLLGKGEENNYTNWEDEEWANSNWGEKRSKAQGPGYQSMPPSSSASFLTPPQRARGHRAASVPKRGRTLLLGFIAAILVAGVFLSSGSRHGSKSEQHVLTAGKAKQHLEGGLLESDTLALPTQGTAPPDLFSPKGGSIVSTEKSKSEQFRSGYGITKEESTTDSSSSAEAKDDPRLQPRTSFPIPRPIGTTSKAVPSAVSSSGEEYAALHGVAVGLPKAQRNQIGSEEQYPSMDEEDDEGGTSIGTGLESSTEHARAELLRQQEHQQMRQRGGVNGSATDDEWTASDWGASHEERKEAAQTDDYEEEPPPSPKKFDVYMRGHGQSTGQKGSSSSALGQAGSANGSPPNTGSTLGVDTTKAKTRPIPKAFGKSDEYEGDAEEEQNSMDSEGWVDDGTTGSSSSTTRKGVGSTLGDQKNVFDEAIVQTKDADYAGDDEENDANGGLDMAAPTLHASGHGDDEGYVLEEGSDLMPLEGTQGPEKKYASPYPSSAWSVGASPRKVPGAPRIASKGTNQPKPPETIRQDSDYAPGAHDDYDGEDASGADFPRGVSQGQQQNAYVATQMHIKPPKQQKTPFDPSEFGVDPFTHEKLVEEATAKAAAAQTAADRHEILDESRSEIIYDARSKTEQASDKDDLKVNAGDATTSSVYKLPGKGSPPAAWKQGKSYSTSPSDSRAINKGHAGAAPVPNSRTGSWRAVPSLDGAGDQYHHPNSRVPRPMGDVDTRQKHKVGVVPPSVKGVPLATQSAGTTSAAGGSYGQKSSSSGYAAGLVTEQGIVAHGFPPRLPGKIAIRNDKNTTFPSKNKVVSDISWDANSNAGALPKSNPIKPSGKAPPDSVRNTTFTANKKLPIPLPTVTASEQRQSKKTYDTPLSKLRGSQTDSNSVGKIDSKHTAANDYEDPGGDAEVDGTWTTGGADEVSATSNDYHGVIQRSEKLESVSEGPEMVGRPVARPLGPVGGIPPERHQASHGREAATTPVQRESDPMKGTLLTKREAGGGGSLAVTSSPGEAALGVGPSPQGKESSKPRSFGPASAPAESRKDSSSHDRNRRGLRAGRMDPRHKQR